MPTDIIEIQPAPAPPARRKPKTGRPIVVTETVVSTILEAMARTGQTEKEACGALDIPWSTWSTWKTRHLNEASFTSRYAQALDAREQRFAEAIEKAALEGFGDKRPPDWRASQYLLERRHAARWAPQTGGVQVNLGVMVQLGDIARGTSTPPVVVESTAIEPEKDKA